MQIDRSNDQLLMRLLDATALRGKVIAGNIANSNTPGFKRQVVEFEDLLREAVGRGPEAMAKVVPRVITDVESPSSFDGNNVTLEGEITAQEENRLMYELFASILATKAEMMRASIEER